MRKGELTRQRIIEESAPIFNQRGFVGCSMQDVMEATGLEKGGIYRHFESKEELAVEAFRYAIGRSRKTKTDGLEDIESAVERLQAFVRRFVATPSALPGGCPLMKTAVEAEDGSPVLRGIAQEAFGGWRERLETMVAEGLESGEIRSEVEPRQVANTMMAALEGGLMISRLEGRGTALKDAAAGLEAMLDGIRAR
jgi:AcrR family transcriptional regulator